MVDYSEQSDKELINALESVGRIPEPMLIDEILARRETLATPLVALFSEALDDQWEDSADPRWYRAVHAGRILLQWREPTAIPTFAALYQSGDDAIGWFEDSIALFGPPAIPYFREVLLSDTGQEWHYGKAFLTDVLAYIALQHPKCRADVLSVLHAALPTLREDGSLDIPIDSNVDDNWGFVVHALAILQDKSSQSLVLAMYESDLIDTALLTHRHYQRMLKEGEEISSRVKHFDLSHQVRDDWEREQTRRRRQSREVSSSQIRSAPAPASQMKVGRNEPCPCGSGRKYKHCCGKK